MHRARLIQGAVAIAVAIAALAAHAQKRPASEAEALIYIESAFITQADPGLLKPNVTVGPELRKKLSLPVGAAGDKVYESVLELVGDKPFAVRKAERDELESYGPRRGFDPNIRQPLFVVVVENTRLLLQYDLQALQVSYVGQLGLLDPEPVAVAAPPPIPLVTASASSKPGAKPVSHAWTAQFEYGGLKLTPQSQALLEAEVLPKLKAAKELRYVILSGHSDRLGSPKFNQQLSEKRAQLLKGWLVERGVDGRRIETFAYGKTVPVRICEQEKRKAQLVECLAPNRRVVIELQAAATP